MGGENTWRLESRETEPTWINIVANGNVIRRSIKCGLTKLNRVNSRRVGAKLKIITEPGINLVTGSHVLMARFH